MSELPRARVVRGGERRVGPQGSVEVAPEQRPHRLEPRALPRALVWRVMFGGPFAVIGWIYAAFFMAFALCGVLDYERLVRVNPDATVTGLLLMPSVGLAFGIFELSFALRALRLLRYGEVTRGKLVAKHDTMECVSDGVVSAQIQVRTLTFEYDVGGKTYSVTVKRDETIPLEGDDGEPLLYDPRTPSRACTLDVFPGSLKVTDRGELEVRRGTAFHLLISPVLFVCLLAATVITSGCGR